MKINKKTAIIILIIVAIYIPIFLYLYFATPPRILSVQPENGAKNVSLNQEISIKFNRKISQEQIEGFLIASDLKVSPEGETVVRGNELIFRPGEKVYYFPETEYIIKIRPVSLLFNKQGKEATYKFKTTEMSDAVTKEMAKKITELTNSFEDGKEKGFEFVTQLPIREKDFTIVEATSYGEDYVELSIIYHAEEELALDALNAWLEERKIDTSKVTVVEYQAD